MSASDAAKAAPTQSPTSRKVIITFAITGAIHTPSMSPYLPVTPDATAASAIRAGSSPSRDCTSRCP